MVKVLFVKTKSSQNQKATFNYASKFRKYNGNWQLNIIIQIKITTIIVFQLSRRLAKAGTRIFSKKKIYLVTNSLFSRKTLSFFVSVSLVRSKSEGTKKNLQKIRVLLLTSHLVSILAVIDPQKILTEIRTGNFFCWVTSRTIYGPFYYVHLIRTEENKNQSIFKRSYYAMGFFCELRYKDRVL